jgi:hypothetical protein
MYFARSMLIAQQWQQRRLNQVPISIGWQQLQLKASL